jgi:hypothetical protein
VPRNQCYAGSRGGQRGNVHLKVMSGEVHFGRKVRTPGDTLCLRRAWYDRPLEYEDERSDERLCPRCVHVAARVGLPVPPAPAAK